LKESTLKEKVLKAIRHAQVEADYPKKAMDIDTKSSIYPVMDEFPEVYFAKQLEKAGGQFIYCKDMFEAMMNLKRIIATHQYDPVYTNEPDIEHFLIESGINFLNYEQGLRTASAAITLCECLVARFGTIVMSSRQSSGRTAHTLSEGHIVIVFKDQVISELSSTFQFLQNKYEKNMPSMITFITGPSRTDAIQGEFVYGVTGAANLFVLYIDM
jgi:L-lactate dehydrogenase complex protein LldG